MFKRLRRSAPSWPVRYDCAHEDHPAAPHWHYGYAMRQWSWDRPDSRQPYYNDHEMHAKGEQS